MKILLASDTWSPMVNGVVRSVELLYHQLLALGHDVRVVTLAQNGHSHEENGSRYVCSSSAERGYPGVRSSAAGALPISHWLDELEARGPEVIHTQCEFATFMLAQRGARRCHCPVVHTYHTVYEDYTQYLFFSERLGRMTAEKATRILSGYCSLMLAPTEKVRAMLNRYGVSCPVVTVPTGIDQTAYGPDAGRAGHPGRGDRPPLAGPSGCREEPRPAGASAGRTAGGEPPVAGVRGRRPRPA